MRPMNASRGWLGLALCAALLPPAHAERISIARARSLCAAGNTGPRTPFGETTEETANKKVAFAWACKVFVEGDVRGAFEQYVSKTDFCDHSHMANTQGAACTDYEASIQLLSRMAGHFVRNGRLDFPTQSAVNGELVTQWGPDADIYRVHDGKITDHWDAAVTKSISLQSHDQAFSDAQQRQLQNALGTPKR